MKNKGLNIPIVYNSNGYENVETLKSLDGYIDVYLPDLKYYYDDIAFKYSGIKEYFKYATEAIKEMYRQVGSPQLDENGIIQKGLIIRHLVLPNNIENSKRVLEWIKENIDAMEGFFRQVKDYNPPLIAREIAMRFRNDKDSDDSSCYEPPVRGKNNVVQRSKTPILRKSQKLSKEMHIDNDEIEPLTFLNNLNDNNNEYQLPQVDFGFDLVLDLD